MCVYLYVSLCVCVCILFFRIIFKSDLGKSVSDYETYIVAVGYSTMCEAWQCTKSKQSTTWDLFVRSCINLNISNACKSQP